MSINANKYDSQTSVLSNASYYKNKQRTINTSYHRDISLIYQVTTLDITDIVYAYTLC